MSTATPNLAAREAVPEHEQKRIALGYLHDAWIEALHDGIDGDCLAQTALFLALARIDHDLRRRRGHAVGRGQFSQRRTERGLRQAIAVDAVVQGLRSRRRAPLWCACAHARAPLHGRSNLCRRTHYDFLSRRPRTASLSLEDQTQHGVSGAKIKPGGRVNACGTAVFGPGPAPAMRIGA